MTRRQPPPPRTRPYTYAPLLPDRSPWLPLRSALLAMQARQPGRFLYVPNEGNAGDALIELRIVAPPVIDAALSDFLQEWRKTHAHDPRQAMMEETPE